MRLAHYTAHVSPPPETPRQLNLFGEPEPAPARGVLPAAVPSELASIADRLPRNIHLGTSSWSFPGWKGIVFDGATAKARLARDGLAAYARHPLLRAVSVDRTFYAPIAAADFERYAAAVPDDFRFLVKACRTCTSPEVWEGRGAGHHNELYLDPGFATDMVVAPFVEGLGAKAGPLVFQFPPQGAVITRAPSDFADALREFFAALPHGPVYAVELRDQKLVTEHYFRVLAEVGVQHCISVHPRMPTVARQREMMAERCEGPLVARWMLRNNLGYEEARERYSPFTRLVDEDPDNRSALAALCREFADAGRDVIVTVNNKAEGCAPLSVFELAAAIVGPEIS